MFLTSTTTVLPTDSPPTDLPPNLSHSNEVSENEILKIIKNSPIKSCLLDPVPTFLLEECVDILLPSITKFANLSLIEGVFPNNSRRWSSPPISRKHHFQLMT